MTADSSICLSISESEFMVALAPSRSIFTSETPATADKAFLTLLAQPLQVMPPTPKMCCLDTVSAMLVGEHGLK